ncbi:disulfide bond formation protein DsbA [Sinomonas albida]|uniref:mycothiol-dependent nitroreductase Rv2466c family protein n=1 Tax=Sinomonas albida TaxID=369942 RepID=UPI0030165774
MTAEATTRATAGAEAVKSRADFWFDPACPFAWVTSRWIGEVEGVRDVETQWHVMSLSVLNEGRELDPDYQRAMDQNWGPVRVIIAASELHGAEHIKPLYDAMGSLIHEDGVKDRPEVIRRALEQVGLPSSLAEYADSDEFDAQLRASHKSGIELVGQEVGTPIVAFNGTAFFGPVMTRVPKGHEAGEIWDASVALASYPHFFEIKRTRTEHPKAG